MYKVIPSNERKLLMYDEIKKLYDGKWVLITHVRFDEDSTPLEGSPAIIADKILEGQETGIYDEIETGEYGNIWTTDLTHMAGHVSSALWEAKK